MTQFILLVTCFGLLWASSANAEPRLELLPAAPEHFNEQNWSIPESKATSVSADGCSIAGESIEGTVNLFSRTVRWTPGGMDVAPGPEGPSQMRNPNISSDGNLIASIVVPAGGGSHVTLWHPGVSIQPIEHSSPFTWRGFVSADGQTLAFHERYTPEREVLGLVRRQGDVNVAIGATSGGATPQFINDLTADGAAIVGAALASDGELEGFRWQAGNTISLGRPLGTTQAYAAAISADGKVIAVEADNRAFVLENGTYREIGPGRPTAISADGKTVVGTDYWITGEWGSLHEWSAFIWTDSGGYRSLADFASLELGLDWKPYASSGFRQALDVSPDGRVVVGTMSQMSVDQYSHGFALYIDDGCVSDGDADGVSDSADNCTDELNVSQFDGDGYGNACDADLSNDGVVGIPDFMIWMSQFGQVEGSPDYDAAADLTNDGVVGIPDFRVLSSQFGNAPGPSAMAP